MTLSLKSLILTWARKTHNTMATSQNPVKRVAVLDDYAGIAPKHFENIKNVKVSYWDQTLDASKDDDLQALIRRLEPYGTLARSIHVCCAFKG